MVAYETVDDWFAEQDGVPFTSSMALHGNIDRLVRGLFKKWRPTLPNSGSTPLLTTVVTNVMVLWLHNHFCMLGVHVDGSRSFYVLLGTSGALPGCVQEYITAIERITHVPCLNKTPTGEPRQRYLNACAAYGCVYARYFMANYHTIDASTARLSFTMGEENHIHAQARALITVLRGVDLREGRGVHNPLYNPNILHTARRIRTRAEGRRQEQARNEVIVIDSDSE